MRDLLKSVNENKKVPKTRMLAPGDEKGLPAVPPRLDWPSHTNGPQKNLAVKREVSASLTLRERERRLRFPAPW